MATAKLSLPFPFNVAGRESFIKPFANLPDKPPSIPLASRRMNSIRFPNRKSAQSPAPGRCSTKVLNAKNSRILFVGAASLGLFFLLMGFEDYRAAALGPEGPLMEEFWDNMRRYGLYVLTVSTGAIYTLLQPIGELLKNPVTAFLVIGFVCGGIFLVSQVVSAMVGLSDFSYDYGY